MEWKLKKMLSLLLEVIILCYMVHGTAVENRECREQEYRDEAGDCVACRQCGSGQELSTECGFGYGAGARCAPCRPGRYKEEAVGQKCKPCLSCAHTSRLHRANCTTTGNAVCGDCLPGFYRKTKLSGFQDMDCVPCGDPPHAYEPLCSSRVNLVPLSSVVASSRDTVLAVVICIALTSVLLALMLFCAIYCKRQLEKKPHEPCQGVSCHDAKFPSFENIQVHQLPQTATMAQA
ncbi:tumor necrosis factor receptor superfamily member 19-like isoform X1 [Oncorhynchus masou masou]|uniref:tumor necrosis factor receptor superfamily member 19-like isoform X1 n=1 Tax=Oncorhynchus masou masou TaxID=90313 RepID=UPI00318455E0